MISATSTRPLQVDRGCGSKLVSPAYCDVRNWFKIGEMDFKTKAPLNLRARKIHKPI